ncbi:MAG: RagB/SusD family nutrient uptake outer membrane protein [Dysgonamonadaceae bacterium]|jgi:hypothetical protein|nr:RagB/SusD family nutrient uptake outer membrane protein [Dysgonamonadaceae bacterium]
MKNIRNFIRLMALPVCLMAAYACSDFLDVVPEKKAELELFFERRNTALGALASCYSFLPQGDVVYHTFSLASEELVTPVEQGRMPGLDIARGRQSSDSPILGYWNDYNFVVNQSSLWKGIRYCNTFIELIDNVGDMEYIEKQQWKAEAVFLKAYYHFLLFTQYGPIPIVDANLPISATPGEMRIERQPVDKVIEYIVNTMDAAKNSLPTRYTDNNAGRVDRVIVAAIKSRVLLYAASPLFNGNAQFYDRFKGKNGELLFNIVEDKEKWEKAAKAAKEAIDLALSYTQIYYHDSISNPVNKGDTLLYGVTDTLVVQQVKVPVQPVKALYDYRYMFTDPWNNELIWGRAYYTSYYRLQAAAFPMSTTVSVSQGAAWSWLAPTLDIVEAYYTRNGLPIEEDRSFNYDNRYRIAKTPYERDTLFFENTAHNFPRLHHGREPRFYASIGFDEAYFWIWGEKWTLHTFKGAANGRAGAKDYSPTGYILAKVQHPKGQSDSYANLMYYPFPIIRLSELYLNYAEALNEYLDEPNQDVWDALNVIRRRAGIPDVELVWGDANLAKTPNKHKNKTGMREIIHAERRIELAFEGNRYFDIKRWKEGEKWLTKEIRGWNIDGETLNEYYKPDAADGLPFGHIYNRSFITPRDYLFPIGYNEMLLNSNLVQNPGW